MGFNVERYLKILVDAQIPFLYIQLIPKRVLIKKQNQIIKSKSKGYTQASGSYGQHEGTGSSCDR